ncbi:hypothetical protein HanPSC8_Chr15g0664141 [Helianthus annuus]|nr:hypothetical protein HanPSC8_Chr15g0664141 [Helianthus annuus]
MMATGRDERENGERERPDARDERERERSEARSDDNSDRRTTAATVQVRIWFGLCLFNSRFEFRFTFVLGRF